MSAPVRISHNHTERKVPPSGGENEKLAPVGEKVKLYWDLLSGNTTQNTYKLTVSSKHNQTADTTKEMLK